MSDAARRWYLDTSVAARILLRHSASAADWFSARISGGDSFVSSQLLLLELSRLYRREGLDLEEIAPFVEQFTLVRFDNSLVVEAAAIRPHLKSLDALHLASAQRIGAGNVTIVTHDATMAKVADALGFDVFDPVES